MLSNNDLKQMITELNLAYPLKRKIGKGGYKISATFKDHKNRKDNTANYPGLDLAGLGYVGEPVTQLVAGWSQVDITPGWGNMAVTVFRWKGLIIRLDFAHCSWVWTQPNKGKNKQKGFVIGKIGSSGNATGPHLHINLRVTGKYGERAYDDTYLDPEPLLDLLWQHKEGKLAAKPDYEKLYTVELVNNQQLEVKIDRLEAEIADLQKEVDAKLTKLSTPTLEPSQPEILDITKTNMQNKLTEALMKATDSGLPKLLLRYLVPAYFISYAIQILATPYLTGQGYTPEMISEVGKGVLIVVDIILFLLLSGKDTEPE